MPEGGGFQKRYFSMKVKQSSLMMFLFIFPVVIGIYLYTAVFYSDSQAKENQPKAEKSVSESTPATQEDVTTPNVGFLIGDESEKIEMFTKVINQNTEIDDYNVDKTAKGLLEAGCEAIRSITPKQTEEGYVIDALNCNLNSMQVEVDVYGNIEEIKAYSSQ